MVVGASIRLEWILKKQGCVSELNVIGSGQSQWQDFCQMMMKLRNEKKSLLAEHKLFKALRIVVTVLQYLRVSCDTINNIN